MHECPGVVLDAILRAFVQQGVSIIVASRTSDNVPRVSRAIGCTVKDDRRLIIHLPSSRSRQLLEAVEVSGTVAVVFSEPRSHKTVQVKGHDAKVTGMASGAEARVAAYCGAFGVQLTDLGYSEAMARALVGVDAADITDIVFTPTAVFDQTPGPRAGEPMVRSE